MINANGTAPIANNTKTNGISEPPAKSILITDDFVNVELWCTACISTGMSYCLCSTQLICPCVVHNSFGI